jgi:hypothetical protein
MAETGSYIPPQSPIAIQPGDKGFEIVGKGYNRWLWTFPDWKKGKKKIIDPAANWGLNSKPMSQDEINKKMKGLYLNEALQKKIEKEMRHVSDYESFLNESKIFEADDAKTSPVEIAPTKTKISVVKTQKEDGKDSKTGKPKYKVLNGAVRLMYTGKKPMDYKIMSQSPLYNGPIVPSNFFKSERGDYYVITTNAGQTQRVETEDINKVIKGYKEGKTSMTIPVYKDLIGIPAKVADLIFKKTSDFSDLK